MKTCKRLTLTLEIRNTGIFKKNILAMRQPTGRNMCIGKEGASLKTKNGMTRDELYAIDDQLNIFFTLKDRLTIIPF